MTKSDISIDMEERNRFYNIRDIDDAAQSFWMFEIFQISMNARTQAIGIVAALFTLASMVLYMIVTVVLQYQTPQLEARSQMLNQVGNSFLLKERHFATSLTAEQQKILDDFTALTKDISVNLDIAQTAFLVIRVFCYLNMMFLVQNFITIIFAKKMGR